MTNIKCFPRWRGGNVSPIDRLEELLTYAKIHPEDVRKLHLVWFNEKGETIYLASDGSLIKESVGMLEVAKFQIMGMHTHEEE